MVYAAGLSFGLSYPTGETQTPTGSLRMFARQWEASKRAITRFERTTDRHLSGVLSR